MPEENSKKTGVDFCRLCGKHRPANDFAEIALAKIGNGMVMYHGCKSCETVIFNALTIVKEIIAVQQKRLQEQAEKKIAVQEVRIIVPGISIPKNPKVS